MSKEIIEVLNTLVIILAVMLFVNHLYKAFMRIKVDSEKTRAFVNKIKNQSDDTRVAIEKHTLRFTRAFLTAGDMILLTIGMLLTGFDIKNGYIFVTLFITILVINRTENFHHHRMNAIRNHHIQNNNDKIIHSTIPSTDEREPT